MKKLILFGIVLVALIFVSGCIGTLSEEEYNEFRRNEFSKSSKLVEEFTSDTPDSAVYNEAYLVRLKSYSEQFYILKSDWDAVTPPSKFRKYHSHHSNYLGYMGESIDLLQQGIEQLDTELFNDGDEALEKAIEEATLARNELAKMGGLPLI